MSLRERVYSILILSATDHFTSAFADLLPETRYYPVHAVSSVSAAKRALAEKAIDTCTGKQSAVLLLVKSDIHTGVHDRVAEYGVFTLPKPTSKSTMIHALNWMESAREHLRQFEKKSLSIEEKMAEIRLVNKAKWILISELSLNEPEAHRYIEKQAMDRCISKRTIAEEIIKTYT